MFVCRYEKGCSVTTNLQGYTPYLCDIHQREQDITDAENEDIRRNAHTALLHRIDDPNDSFNEDDLELLWYGTHDS